MTSHLFSSFRDASSFAKRSMLESKGGVRLRRSENGFVVEVAEAHSKPQELAKKTTSTPSPNLDSHSTPVGCDNSLDGLSIDDAKNELERIIIQAWRSDEPLNYQRDFFSSNGKRKLDMFFFNTRLGVVVCKGGDETSKELLYDVEQELAWEEVGITFLRFSVDEIFGDRRSFITKLMNAWTAATRKEAKIKPKAVSYSNSSRRSNSRGKRQSSSTGTFKGGWTSLSQGKMHMGDSTYEKAKVNEGFGGTREQNIRMRYRGGS